MTKTLFHPKQKQDASPPNILLKASVGLCFLAYGWVLLLIALLSVYSVPVADDFCYASKALRYGLLGAVEDEYNTWSGRYSSTFIMAWFTLNLDLIHHYWAVTASVVTAMLLGILTFLWSLTARPGIAVALSLPIFVLMSISMPKPGEVFFWLAGGATYGLGSGFMLLWLSGMIAFLRTTQLRSAKTWFLFLALVPGTIFLPGFQESLMLMVLAVAFLFALASFIVPRPLPLRLGFITLLVLSFIAGLIIAENPGSAFRASNHALAGNLFLVPIIQALLLAISLTLVVPSQLGAWASAIAVAGLWPRKTEEEASPTRLCRGGNKRPIWFFVIGGLLVIFAANLAPAWGIGGPPSPRAFTPQYTFGFLGFVGLLLAFTPVIQAQFSRLGWSDTFRNRVLALILCLHALSIVSSDFVGQGTTNLIIGGETPAATYKAQWVERFAKIQEAKYQGQQELAVEPLTQKPSLLYVGDLGAPNNWRSQCFSSYWGFKSIHVTD